MTFSVKPEPTSPNTNLLSPISNRGLVSNLLWGYYSIIFIGQRSWLLMRECLGDTYCSRLSHFFLNFPLCIGHVLGIETICPQLWQRKGISQSLDFCFRLRALRIFLLLFWVLKPTYSSHLQKRKFRCFSDYHFINPFKRNR